MEITAKFHLSLPCINIMETKQFYIDDLGLNLGRNSEKWLDVNLYGHQLTFTEAGEFNFNNPNYIFEKHVLPSFHFGVVLDTASWDDIYKRFNAWNIEVTTPKTFLEDKQGEHISFFVTDPNGYLIEFKSFKEDDSIFSE
jgi:hypothetical protein